MEEITQSVLRNMEAKYTGKAPLLVAIDGRCAAGKTTLAACLQRALFCNVIHMDHFFLRPEQRTAERLSEPGGNVDYERFLEEILLPLEKGEDFLYRPYDFQQQDFSEAISVKANAITIIEGSYSCHPALRDHYDLRIFLSTDTHEQLRRIGQRNGVLRVADFRHKWIPLEEQYFLSCHVQKHSDLLYET